MINGRLSLEIALENIQHKINNVFYQVIKLVNNTAEVKIDSIDSHISLKHSIDWEKDEIKYGEIVYTIKFKSEYLHTKESWEPFVKKIEAELKGYARDIKKSVYEPKVKEKIGKIYIYHDCSQEIEKEVYKTVLDFANNHDGIKLNSIIHSFNRTHSIENGKVVEYDMEYEIYFDVDVGKYSIIEKQAKAVEDELKRKVGHKYIEFQI